MITDSFAFVPQLDAADCGAASLSMVARHHGLPHAPAEIRDRVPTDTEGTTLFHLAEAARSLGFTARALYLPYDALSSEAPLPLIAHWREQHFVVVYRATDREVHFADPAAGKRTLSREAFEAGWLGKQPGRDGTGRVLVLQPPVTPTAAPPTVTTAPGGWQRFRKLLFAYPGELLLLLLTILIGVICVLVIPLLLRTIVDYGIQDMQPTLVTILVGAISVAVLGYYTLEVVRGSLLRTLGARLNGRFYRDFLDILLRLPLGFFTQRFGADVLRRLDDPRIIDRWVSNEVPRFAVALIYLLALGWVFWYFSPSLFGIFFLGTTLYFAVGVLLRRRFERREAELRQQELESGYLLEEMVEGIADLKVNDATDAYLRQQDTERTERIPQNLKYHRSRHHRDLIGEFIADARNLSITLLAAYATIGGHLSLGALLGLQYALGQVDDPARRVLAFFESYQRLRQRMARTDDVFQRRTEAPATGQAAGGNIGVEELDFAYPANAQPVLRGLNFNIPKRSSLGIVGASGSGKTTLLKLLAGVLEAESGRVLRGTQSLAEVAPEVRFTDTAVLFQDGYVFTDSILKNVALGDAAPDEARAREALRRADLLTTVDQLPDGIYTTVGRFGRPLSRGQERRLLLARGILPKRGLCVFG